VIDGSGVEIGGDRNHLSLCSVLDIGVEQANHHREEKSALRNNGEYKSSTLEEKWRLKLNFI
jgi:hypothetical protein